MLLTFANFKDVWFSTELWAFSYSIGLFCAIVAIYRTRTSQGAVAWAVALISFPIITVPLYLVFGRRSFRGYLRARQINDRSLESARSELLSAKTQLPFQLGPSVDHLKVFETIAGTTFLKNNAVRLLINGEQTFDAMTAAIEDAKHYVLFQFYILRDDKLGQKFKELLIKKVEQGVRVYVLYDAIGSNDLGRRYVKELVAAGVEIASFYSTKKWWPPQRFQVNFRNHRKIVIVDGTRVFLGGHNVGDEYLSQDPNVGFWRDTHMEIDGPSALVAQVSFLEDWHWSTDKLPDLRWEAEARGVKVPVLILATGPNLVPEGCSLFFIQAIGIARQRLWIATPYFVPDEQVVSALQLAVMRGVDVKIIITRKTDALVCSLATYSLLEDVIPYGVKTYFYEKGFAHQKVMLVDDDLAAIGSANFDNRSFRLNFEITGFVFDRDFAAEVANMLEEDLANSVLVSMETLTSKPFWFRFACRVARLFAPIL
jgi:cardiolipin synthase